MLSLSEMIDDGEVCNRPATQADEDDEILYPQANSLEKVLDVVKVLRVSGMTVYGLVNTGIVNSSRQARYYYNAAAFLGFCYRRGDFFYPTDLADELNAVPEESKKEVFAAMVLENGRVGDIFTGIFRFADKDERISWIEKRIAPNIVAKATLRRRASCLHAWVAWLQQNLRKIKG